MQKNEYTTPVLEELGDLKIFTLYGVIGENFDGAFPSGTNESYGS